VLTAFGNIAIDGELNVWRYRWVPKFWTHRTKTYYVCDTSVREKAWRSRKRVAQAT
jgi:hypothetical protein